MSVLVFAKLLGSGESNEAQIRVAKHEFHS